jgi:hypothetical protein
MVQIFKAIRFDPEQDIIINCDNQQSVRIVTKETPTLSIKLRHVQWVPTSEMAADGLTKALSKQNHQKFVEVLGLRDIRPLVN